MSDTLLDKNKIWQQIDDEKENMLQLWQELVNVDCGSGNKAGVDFIAQKIEAILKTLGFTTTQAEFEKAGNTLVGKIGDTSKDFIVLLGHMDTVFKDGTVAERPFKIVDGKAYGPGCLDMKGGIVIMLTALKVLLANNYSKHGIKVILAGDEEVAHYLSNASETILAESKGALAAFNFETGFLDQGVVTRRKGRYEFTMEAYGRGAHVGNDPQNGRSAIIELMHKGLDIEALTDFDKGINFNVGLFEGGTVSNAVPDYAKLTCDTRYTDYALLEEFLPKLQAIAANQYVPDTKTVLKTATEFQSMDEVPGTAALLQLVQEAAAECNLPQPTAKAVGGGSDSAYATAAGVPTICALGVQGARNHTAEEFAVVDTLFSRCKLFATIMLNI